MSNIKRLTSNDFSDNGDLLLDKNNNSIILFYAEFCPACKNFKPTFEKVAEDVMTQSPNIKFYMVSTADNRDLMSKVSQKFPYEVQYIPTVVRYNNGKYFSTYDYDKSNPEARKEYRTPKNLKEYAYGVGKSKLNFY
jgi:thiol-disulfide isomerase/thioredoxin